MGQEGCVGPWSHDPVREGLGRSPSPTSLQSLGNGRGIICHGLCLLKALGLVGGEHSLNLGFLPVHNTVSSGPEWDRDQDDKPRVP